MKTSGSQSFVQGNAYLEGIYKKKECQLPFEYLKYKPTSWDNLQLYVIWLGSVDLLRAFLQQFVRVLYKAESA